ncbi:hypothetical protein [Leisingera sp. ANG-S5]|uniref:hypothetical protein n=1 Tax=Leisingera sp. ANG-S5 TaxID=1577901 RepID=UPI000A5E1FCA|nr:hypothetical protein [Leisingera sp. ANG-S5]
MTEDEVVQVELETGLVVPPPLDPHIASVSIRTGSNNPTDYFDLLLSASFGAEYVTINSGGDKIEVKLTIKKAEIKVDTSNCDLHLLSDKDSEGWVGSETRETTSERKTRGSSDTTIGVSNSGTNISTKANLNASVGATCDGKSQIVRQVLPWRVLSADTVQFGYIERPNEPLIGRMLDEDVLIRVTPSNLGQRIGVLARLRVRERWIDLEVDETSLIGASKKFGDFLKSLIGHDAAALRKKELFSMLLAHLVTKELQAEEEGKDATLAAAAVVFSPRSEKFGGLPLPHNRKEIKVDPTAIDQFISRDGEEEDVLREIGVDFEPDVDGDTGEFGRDFQKIWKMRPPGDFCFRSVDIDVLQQCYSLSFGLVARIKCEENNGPWLDFSVEITDEPYPQGDAEEILDLLGAGWRASEAAVYFSILTKGEQSLTVAELFGFRKTYQSLRKRLKDYSVKSGYGNLVSFGRVISEVSAEGKVEGIAGAKRRFRMWSRED